ncbi:MAG: LysR family transcriptional regulator, partial [Pseudomonadota bacterium]
FMNYHHFRNIDLNLLIVFLTLLQERSVSKTAIKLNMTQPAVSQSLKRLKHLLKDDLFIRSGRNIEPTETALSYQSDLEHLFEQMDHMFHEKENFDPQTYNGHIKIGLPEYCAIPFIPALQKILSKEAPHIRITTLNTNIMNAYEMLQSKTIDFAIGRFENMPKSIEQTDLYHEKYVGISSAPVAKTIKTKDDYFNHNHLHVSLRGEDKGFIDDCIKKEKLGRRNIEVTLSNYIFSLEYLKNSDLIATEPYYALRKMVDIFGLKYFDLPIHSPEFSVSLGYLKTRSKLQIVKWFNTICEEAVARFS